MWFCIWIFRLFGSVKDLWQSEQLNSLYSGSPGLASILSCWSFVCRIRCSSSCVWICIWFCILFCCVNDLGQSEQLYSFYSGSSGLVSILSCWSFVFLVQETVSASNTHASLMSLVVLPWKFGSRLKSCEITVAGFTWSAIWMSNKVWLCKWFFRALLCANDFRHKEQVKSLAFLWPVWTCLSRSVVCI